MSLDEVKKEVEKIIQEEKEYPEQSLLEYYQEFLNADVLHRTEAKTPHPFDMLMVSWLTNSPETIFEKKELLEKLNDAKIFDPFFELSDIYLTLKRFTQEEKENFLKNLEKNNIENFEKNYRTFLATVDESLGKMLLNNLSSFLEKTEASYEDCFKIIELMVHATEEEKQAFYYFAVYSQVVYNYMNDSDFTIKDLNKEAQESLKKNYNAILDCYREYEKGLKNFNKNTLKIKGIASKLLKKLNNPLEGYQSLTEEEIKFLPLEVIDDVLGIYIPHNEILLKEIQKELDFYNGNKESNFKKIFSKYKVPFFKNSEYVSNILLQSEEEVEEKIKKISKYKYHWKEETLFLVMNQKLEELKKIDALLIKNIISFPFFEEHINEFTNIEELNRIAKNIEGLKKYSLECKNLDEILLKTEKELEEKISWLELYGLKLNSTLLKCAFLPNFFDIVDLWIEKGIISYFENNIEEIKEDLLGITKRIFVAMLFHIPVFDENGKINNLVTSENKFFISTSDIDQYLCNATPYYVTDKQEGIYFSNLEENMLQTNLTYEISGVIISRPKIIRNLPKNQLITKNILLYGSLKSIEECEKIKRFFEEDQDLILQRKK